MEIELEKSGAWGNEVKDVFIKNEGKIIKIIYGGSGDLFIKALPNMNEGTFVFEIQERDPCFKLFESLIADIVNCNVFEENPKLSEILKNSFVYNKIYDGKQIILYSDSCCDDDANKLVIFKSEKGLVLKFVSNERDSIRGHGIRISNSGSKYTPFNICFMRWFRAFQSYKEKCTLRK